MEGIYAFCVGMLTASGVYLMLRARTFPVVVGITLISYAVNLFLFASGRLQVDGAVILGESAVYSDPLPQALVLTAIVIGFAMTGFITILAIRARADMGNDHVDGNSQSEDSGKQKEPLGTLARRPILPKLPKEEQKKDVESSLARTSGTAGANGNKRDPNS